MGSKSEGRPNSRPSWIEDAQIAPGVKLIAIDIDHTLISSNGELRPRTIAAINLATTHGLEVVLASSRPPRAMIAFLSPLQLWSPIHFVALQGGLTAAYRNDGSLAVQSRSEMSLPDALKVVELSKEAGVSVNWYRDDKWLVSNVDQTVTREASIVGFDPDGSDLETTTEPPQKLLLINDGDADTFSRLVTTRLPMGLSSKFSNSTYLEVTASGVDKSTAIRRLAKLHGYERRDVVAIGDGENDIGMLGYAGISIAMGNAIPAVMDVASWVTASNDDDGVAVAIETLLAKLI